MKNCHVLYILVFVLCFTIFSHSYASQQIDLVAGFNFVGLTVTPSQEFTSTSLLNANPEIVSIFTYSSESQRFLFHTRLTNGTLFGSSINLVPGTGFIVRCSAARSIQVDGADVKGIDLDLKPGFNLFGVPVSQSPGTAKSFLGSNQAASTIFSWDSAVQRFELAVKTGSGSVFGQDFSLSSGKAYIVKVSSAFPVSFGTLVTLKGVEFEEPVQHVAA